MTPLILGIDPLAYFLLIVACLETGLVLALVVDAKRQARVLARERELSERFARELRAMRTRYPGAAWMLSPAPPAPPPPPPSNVVPLRQKTRPFGPFVIWLVLAAACYPMPHNWHPQHHHAPARAWAS